jgi:hypothetical protein
MGYPLRVSLNRHPHFVNHRPRIHYVQGRTATTAPTFDRHICRPANRADAAGLGDQAWRLGLAGSAMALADPVRNACTDAMMAKIYQTKAARAISAIICAWRELSF